MAQCIILMPQPIFKQLMMKYLVLFIAVTAFASSCNPIMYPLPGKNYDEISNIKTSKTTDSAWATVYRILTTNGFTIKSNDKNTGEIVTDKYDFGDRFSFVRNGKPIDSTAWVALSYNKNRGGFNDTKFHIYAHWTVQIKSAPSGSLIRIDMSKVNATGVKPGKNSYHQEQEYDFAGQSTGVFEKMLADAVR